MAVYQGLQLPSMDGLDDRKERKQILNYLVLLDEKLRYMFQNIDPEENYTASAFQNYIKTEKGLTSLQVEQGKISSLVSDLEGDYSLLEQTVSGISSVVVDLEGNFSLLEQTVNGISSIVADMEGNISILEQTTDGIKSTVADMDGELSQVSQQADKISWIVASGTSASNFTLTSRMANLVAAEIDVTGFVTFNDLSKSGKTTINGDNITTGEISSEYIHLGGLMEVYRSGYSTIVGGYIGYDTGDDGNASTSGIKIASPSENNYVICTNSGVRMTYYDDNAVYCISNGVHMTAGSYGTVLDDSSGNFCPDVDDDQLLGKSNRLWQGLYAGNATIQTSDRRKKNSIDYDMGRYETFFHLLKPTQYKLNNGDSGRYHVGFISQDVEEAMEEAGLTSLDFAGFIKSPVYEVEDEKGDYDTSSPIVDYRYALRYGEFVALNTYMIQRLYERVERLEGKA